MLVFRIKTDSASLLQIKFSGIPEHELHGPIGSPRFPLWDAAIWRAYTIDQLMQQCQIEGGQHPGIRHQTVSETKWYRLNFGTIRQKIGCHRRLFYHTDQSQGTKMKTSNNSVRQMSLIWFLHNAGLKPKPSHQTCSYDIYFTVAGLQRLSESRTLSSTSRFPGVPN
jgi:hypothetical protein